MKKNILLIVSFMIFLLPLAIVVKADGHKSTKITQVALAAEVIDRQPDYSFDRSLSCDNEPDSVTVSISDENKVYLWNRVSNKARRTIVHSWQQKSDGQWRDEANVKLSIGKSGGWRSWSSKNLDVNFHLGSWRVVISPEDEPEDVLCTVYFKVVE